MTVENIRKYGSDSGVVKRTFMTMKASVFLAHQGQTRTQHEWRKWYWELTSGGNDTWNWRVAEMILGTDESQVYIYPLASELLTETVQRLFANRRKSISQNFKSIAVFSLYKMAQIHQIIRELFSQIMISQRNNWAAIKSVLTFHVIYITLGSLLTDHHLKLSYMRDTNLPS
jgi:hypothetical protein